MLPLTKHLTTYIICITYFVSYFDNDEGILECYEKKLYIYFKKIIYFDKFRILFIFTFF